MNDTVPLPSGTVSRRSVLWRGSAILASAALGCPSVLRAQSGPRRGGVLRVAAPNNPVSLDPITGIAGSDHTFLYCIYETLVSWDFNTLAPVPALAEQWAYKDPRTLVLTLRQGVTFHDGTSFNAEAAKFNLDRTRDGEISNVKADIAAIDSIEITGPYEVTLKLKDPDAALLLALSDRAGFQVSPTAVQKQNGRVDRNPVGTGAYRFVSWADAESVVVERNGSYWQKDQPYLDGIRFQIIREIDTGLRSVIAGENDVAFDLAPRQRAVIKRASNVKDLLGASLGFSQLYLNYGRPPLNDPRVRKALDLTIDRDVFTKATTFGLGQVAQTVLPPSHWAYDPTLPAAKADPEKARQLLAEAGFAKGLEVEFMGNADQRAQQQQEVLIEQLRKGGFEVRWTRAPLGSGPFFRDKTGAALLTGWSGRPDPSMTFRSLYALGAFWNAGNADPTNGLIGPALQAAQDMADLNQRKPAFVKLHHMVRDYSLSVPLAYDVQLVALLPKVGGYRLNLLGKARLDGVYLTEA
jgi:ABC-type transport system substrate-binding protein